MPQNKQAEAVSSNSLSINSETLTSLLYWQVTGQNSDKLKKVAMLTNL